MVGICLFTSMPLIILLISIAYDSEPLSSELSVGPLSAVNTTFWFCFDMRRRPDISPVIRIPKVGTGEMIPYVCTYKYKHVRSAYHTPHCIHM